MRRGGSAYRYQQVWENLTARAPEHLRIAHSRRQTAQQLLTDLAAQPPESWIAQIQKGGEPFRSQDLFDLLLETCQGALPFEPLRAFEVSKAAVEVGRLLASAGAENPQTLLPAAPVLEEALLCRALCLNSHALRLLGQREHAEAALTRAACFLGDPSARGFYGQALGLLRWDQGREEEAVAFLHHAGRRYRELGDVGEEAKCAALLGLLYLRYDDGAEWQQAESALLRAQSGMDCQQRPWLAAQAQLALARCQALRGRRSEARALRQSVRSLYPSVPTEDDLAALHWLEAQIAQDLEELEGAGTLLDSARRSFVARGCLPEATLTTLQLGWIRARQGRGEETSVLSDELTRVFGMVKGFDVSSRALQCLARETARRSLKGKSLAYPKLFLSFRVRGVFPRPIPFV
ncbi:MAG TPA: hypothetical protein VF173_05015 [Thermoanaerobaculia bacterium]|nr:hypothetical protein [Thermoanaerobaculia bacterium]